MVFMQTYWKNLFGMKMTDEEDQDITHPAVELYCHVTDRCIMMGTILGSMVIGPVVAVVKGPRNGPNVSRLFFKGGKIGLLSGLAIGPVMTYARAKNFTHDEYFDRAFRLRRHKTQMTIDRVCGVTMTGGLILGLVQQSFAPLVLGVTGGVLAANAYTMATGAKKTDSVHP